MGYETLYDGAILIDRPVDHDTHRLLLGLHKTRRMKRNVAKLVELGFSAAEIGTEGEFFVEDGQDDTILDYNEPPGDQPSRYCDWMPTPDGRALVVDSPEHSFGFDDAYRWLEYLIHRVLAPRGYVLNGVMNVRGDDFYDLHHIVVQGNQLSAGSGFAHQVTRE